MLSEISEKNDIVDYVSQYVALKRSGKTYLGLCPFHAEKTPSFHVNREKQLFHCFGCGAGGNLFQFVMRAENLDFKDAMKLLADRAGVIIPEDDERADDEKHKRRKRIYEMNKLSGRFYYDKLTKTPEGRIGLKYFAGRKINAATIRKYGLGYASDEYDALRKYLNEKGFSDKEIIDAGLVTDRNGRLRDKFRNRVMFPIIDVRGNVIGFGGRIINDNQGDGFKAPKYLNSPETPVFDKGKSLFSLNFAKNAHSNQIILCEGYMDVISSYQAGIENITATLGTAITQDQARLLSRYSSEIIICYDMDEAGQKAALRAIDVINSIGGKCRVMQLKGAKDPDEYIKTYGVSGFKKAVSSAAASTDFRLTIIRRKYNIESPDGKVQFIAEAADMLAGLSNAVEVDAYVKKISEETQISREAIYSEYKRRTSYRNKQKPVIKRTYERKDPQRGETLPTPAERRENEKIASAEKQLLRLICEDKRYYSEAKNMISPEDFSDEVYRKIARQIYDIWESGGVPEASSVLNSFFDDADDAGKASGALFDDVRYEDSKAAVRELIINLNIKKTEKELKQESAKDKQADFGKIFELNRKLNTLKDELKR